MVDDIPVKMQFSLSGVMNLNNGDCEQDEELTSFRATWLCWVALILGMKNLFAFYGSVSESI
jgi:hypothetical protein